MDAREKDVQTLCNAILDYYPRDTGDCGTGRECPFCGRPVLHNEPDNLRGIKHNPDCIVLIAKDLTTNI